MKLRGIEFGDVVWASGTFGYVGEKRNIYGMLFAQKAAFITRPVTAFELPKTFPMRSISEIGAGMICSTFYAGNIGIEKLLSFGKLQQQKNPFFISVMFSGSSVGQRLAEAEKIRDVLMQTPKNFRSQFGVVISFADPADGTYDSFNVEIQEIFDILSEVGVPLVAEVSMFFSPDVVQQIAAIPTCDAIMLRSSILWTQMSAEAHTVFFRTKRIPLSHTKDGIVYGKYLLPLAVEWIRQAKKYAGNIPLLAGGGILNISAVEEVVSVGANAIVLDRANFLRFWNITSIVSRIQTYRAKK